MTCGRNWLAKGTIAFPVKICSLLLVRKIYILFALPTLAQIPQKRAATSVFVPRTLLIQMHFKGRIYWFDFRQQCFPIKLQSGFRWRLTICLTLGNPLPSLSLCLHLYLQRRWGGRSGWETHTCPVHEKMFWRWDAFKHTTATQHSSGEQTESYTFLKDACVLRLRPHLDSVCCLSWGFWAFLWNILL